MEILTEFDELQNAMTKINLDESVFPYCNGRLVQNDAAYNKIQKILNCPEMVSCHKYLYNLDLDQLNEDEVDKVDKLYKLGCDRGFIIDDLTDWDAETSVDAAVDGIVNSTKDDVKPTEDKPAEAKPISGTLFKAKIPCWTIIYSATSKDGQIKTGEAYSNAISADAAKADVKSKLSNIGYSNITILAIESCEADVEATSFKSDEPSVETVAEADDEKSDDEAKDESSDEESSDEESEDSEDEETTEDSEDEETTEDSEDEESSDDEESSEDTSDETSSDEDSEETSDEETSDEETTEDSEDEKSEDSEDEESSGEESEDSEESNEDKEELDANEKAELKDKYKKIFKNTLVKCKFTKSFNDLSLEEKVKFFTQLSKAWTKNEPNEFMTDKEMEQLNNVVVNPDGDED